MQVDNNFVTNKNVRSVNMFLKTLVVRMMAVFALMGILIGATPSQAAEKKSYTSKELKMMSAIIFCEAGNQSKAGKTAVGIVVMNRKIRCFSKLDSRCSQTARTVYSGSYR